MQCLQAFAFIGITVLAIVTAIHYSGITSRIELHNNNTSM